MTTNTATIAPTHATTTVKPSRTALIVIAGVGTSVLSAVALALIFAIPMGASTLLGMIVGTLLVGQLIGARTLKRWTYAFALLFVGQFISGLIVIALTAVMTAA